MDEPPERTTGLELPDPEALRTRAQFAAALTQLKSSRSYREITEAAEALTPSYAAQVSGIDGWRPEALTRGTVSDWITGRGLPTRTKLLTFLVVSGVPAARVEAWLAAWTALQRRHPDPDPPEAIDAPKPTGLRRRHRLSIAVGAAVVTLVLVLGAVALRAGAGGPVLPTPTRPDPTPAPMTLCSFVADGVSIIQPSVTTEGVESGLAFCPVRINDRHLPITGPFSLAGQVIGSVEVRQRMLLINHGDPQTCDAEGNPTPPEGFLARSATIGSPDGSWSYVDGLGYPEAVTIARQFQYLLGSPSSIRAVEDDERTWDAAHPGQDGDYPGIESLPADVTVLATFTVPAGIYPGAVPCRN